MNILPVVPFIREYGTSMVATLDQYLLLLSNMPALLSVAASAAMANEASMYMRPISVDSACQSSDETWIMHRESIHRYRYPKRRVMFTAS